MVASTCLLISVLLCSFLFLCIMYSLHYFPQAKKKEDRISKLPDEIVESIISMLSVNEAARMGVVSRRWKLVWKKAIMRNPRLVLYDTRLFTDPNQCAKYIIESSQVVKLHEAPTLDELTICFGLLHKCSNRISDWFEFAAQKKVQKLKLDFFPTRYGYNDLYDPDHMYNNWFGSTLRSLYWPRLKDCYLNNVNLVDNDIECLLSNSPLLERLCLRNSIRVQILKILKAPNLKFLEIRRCHSLGNIEISAPNLEDLIISCYGEGIMDPFRYVKISAPNLVSFKFYGVFRFHSPLVFMDSLPPDLSHVTLGLVDSDKLIASTYNFVCFPELIAHFPQVNRLRIDLKWKVVEVIAKNSEISQQQFIELTNLEHLEMSMQCPRSPVSLLWLCTLVKAAPFLYSLSIKLSYLESVIGTKRYSLYNSKMINLEWKDEDIPNKMDANIRRSHKYLKVVELFGFVGFRHQVELVLHLVEIAASLEKLIIDIHPPSNYWDDNILKYNKNHSEESSRACAELLRTQIPHEIDVIII